MKLKRTVFFFLFLAGYFVVCEMIVRYEALGAAIAFNYEKTRTLEGLIRSDYIYDVRNGNTGLIPNKSGYFKGVMIYINSLGMRDKEYSLQKAKGTFRIVALGTSTTFGFGVPIESVYHSVLEDRLNEQNDSLKYEVLNFGGGVLVCSAQCLLEKMQLLPAYDVDMVLLSVSFSQLHDSDMEKLLDFQGRTGIAVAIFDFDMNKPLFLQSISKKNLFMLNLGVSYGKDDWIYPADGHPNAHIHALYAQKLYDFFEQHKEEIFARSHPKDIAVELPEIDPTPNSHYKNGFLKSYFFEGIRQKTELMKTGFPRL